MLTEIILPSQLLFHWFHILPERNLHIITVGGLVIAFTGIFYLSYDFLDRPSGLLRWMLQFTMFILGNMFVFSFPFFLLSFIMSQISPSGIAENILFGLAVSSALFAGMIGGFNGIFANTLDTNGRVASHPVQSKPPLSLEKKPAFLWFMPPRLLRPSHQALLPSWRGLLKGAFIGCIFMSIYWLLAILFLFRPSSDITLFVGLISTFVGGVAGGFWLGYIHPPPHTPRVPLSSALSTLKSRKVSLVLGADQFGTLSDISDIAQRERSDPIQLVNQFGRPIRSSAIAQAGAQGSIREWFKQMIASTTATTSPTTQSLFSKEDGLVGLWFWLLISFLVMLLFGLVTIPLQMRRTDPGQQELDTFLTTLSEVVFLGGILASVIGFFSCGIARFIVWWTHYCSPKRLGVVGILLTLIGFSMQLVEPLAIITNSPPSPIALLTYRGDFRGDYHRVFALAWSPDGKYIASGGDDATVQVWNTSTGETVGRYRHIVNVVAWSPDGKYIATGESDGTVHVWDAFTGASILIYTHHHNEVNAVTWSPDGKYIASGGFDQNVQVWNAHTGASVFTYTSHRGIINAVAWSPDGRHIASAGSDGTVQVWNAFTGDKVVTYTGNFDPFISSVAWSPDSKHIASGDPFGDVQVWDADTGGTIYTYLTNEYIFNRISKFKSVRAVAWSPDSNRIAIGCDDGTVQVWDAFTGENVITYTGHRGPVYEVVWSPDGKRIASAGSDSSVQIWNPSLLGPAD